MKSKRKHKGAHPRTETAGQDSLAFLLHNGIIALACVAVFSPLAVSSDFYFPHVFLKSLVFRVCAEGMLALYVLLAAAFPRYRPKFGTLSLTLLAYFAVVLLSSLPGISANAWNSWWGSFSRMEGMVTQLHLLAYFLVLLQTVRKASEWNLLFSVFLFVALLMGFTGLVEGLSPGSLYTPSADPRTQGAAGNAGYFAAHLMFGIFVAGRFLFAADRNEVYPMTAKVWACLLPAVDLIFLFHDHFAQVRGGALRAIAESPSALFALLALHILVFGWFFGRRLRFAGAAAICTCGVFLLAMMLKSQTRGAVLGLVVALAFTIPASLAFMKKEWKRSLSIILALLLLTLPFVFLSADSGWIGDNLTIRRLWDISPADASAKFRLLMWRETVRGILDRPFLGWGPENFRYAFDQHFPTELFLDQTVELWADRAHNLVLDTGIASGLAGLAVAVFFCLKVLAFLFGRWRGGGNPGESLVFLGLMIAYIVQGLFWFDSINTYPQIFLVFAYLGYLHAGHREPESSAPLTRIARPGGAGGRIRAAILVTVPVMSVCAWLAVAKPYATNQALMQAVSRKEVYDPRSGLRAVVYDPVAVSLFEEAGQAATTGRYAAREEFANYALELARAGHVPPEQKVEAVKKAVSMLDESIRQDPDNVRHYQYRAVTVNLTLGMIAEFDEGLFTSLAEENLGVLHRAKALSPTRGELYLVEADTFFLMGRQDERLNALEKGAEMSPANKRVQMELMRGYIKAGMLEPAAALWARMRHLALPIQREDYEMIVAAYEEAGAFPAMAALLEEQISQGDDPAPVLLRLAATYRDMGNFDLARKTADRALSAAAQLRDEVQALLESIDRRESEALSRKPRQPEP